MRLIHGEALATLRGMADASVDAVVTDPPYGTTRSEWDRPIPFAPMWHELRRVAKRSAPFVLFAAQPFSSLLVVSNLDEFQYEWAWDKANPSGHLNAKKRPLSQHELIEVFCRETPPYFPQMRKGKFRQKGSRTLASDCYGEQRGSVTYGSDYYPTSLLRYSNAEKAGRQHPNQKPLDLMRFLVRTYSAPGDVVLDFSMGGGTTGVACVREDRDFIGIEQSLEYVEIARKRVAEAEAHRDGHGGELFAGLAPPARR